MQVVVACPILVVLEGRHSEREGPHAARAPVGQPHLQTHGVAHPAGRGLTVTGLSVHQHICKGQDTELSRALPRWPCAPVCPPFIVPFTPSPFPHQGSHPVCAGWVLGTDAWPSPCCAAVQAGEDGCGHQSCPPEGLCHAGGARGQLGSPMLPVREGWLWPWPTAERKARKETQNQKARMWQGLSWRACDLAGPLPHTLAQWPAQSPPGKAGPSLGHQRGDRTLAGERSGT